MLARIYVAGPLLSTKIGIPPLRRVAVEKTHLMDLLTEGIRGPVTLVSAPPGFGKSTLLQSWCQTADGRRTSVAWLSIDEDDNETGRYLTYVAAALDAALPGVGVDALELLRSSSGTSPRSVMTLLLNNVHKHGVRVVLVLDDYHLVTHSGVHEEMTFLLGHQPRNLHLVLLARADPPLPLARLRVQGSLREIRAHHLRFAPEDAEVFLNDTMGLGLSRDHVSALATRTEGWVAGLQLAALSLQGRGDVSGFVEDFAGSHQYVLDYLVEEVLQRLTVERHDFLLKTSVLQRLSGSLCDALTGDSNGDAMLEQLAAENLFTLPLDSTGTWFRFHHLFAEFLRHRLRRSGFDEKLLRVKAAEWCVREGLFGEALSYAFSADDYHLAAGILEDLVDDRWRQGDIRALLDWFARLPADVLAAHPRLALAYAQTEMFFGHFDRVREHLAVARAGYQERPESLQAAVSVELAAVEVLSEVRDGVVHDVEKLECVGRDLPSGHPLCSRIQFFIGLAHWMNGEVSPALHALRQAQELSIAQGDRYSYQIATCYVTRIQACAADWTGAVRTARMLLESSGGGGMCGLHANLGALLLEANELHEAAELLEADRQRAVSEGDAWVTIGTTATLARVRQAQGQGGEAATLMDAAVTLARQHGLPWTWISAPLHAYQIRLHLQQGRLDEAAAVAAEAAQNDHSGLHLPLLAEAHALAKLRIVLQEGRASGDFNALRGAAAALAAQRQPALQSQRVAHAIEALILLALTFDALGERGEAVGRFETLWISPKDTARFAPFSTKVTLSWRCCGQPEPWEPSPSF